MRASPAVRAARTGLSGRRVQAMVIGLVVLIATAASTLALGLLVDSNAPFDHAFAARHGSEVTAATQASPAQLAGRGPGGVDAGGHLRAALRGERMLERRVGVEKEPEPERGRGGGHQ